MPKYYCDYCDIFLTHDSASVRKAHNTGWKHISMVREYYSELGQDKTQAVIDQITMAYSGTGFNPMIGPIHPMIRPMGPPMYGRPPVGPPPGNMPPPPHYRPGHDGPPPPSNYGPPSHSYDQSHSRSAPRYPSSRDPYH